MIRVAGRADVTFSDAEEAFRVVESWTMSASSRKAIRTSSSETFRHPVKD